ncbi:MAG: 2-hydroxychromene-2-carboxylate isomerase [Sulfuritalea sp.]|nr:2-hydroxychromene-2-carboxylate isomerase [Sulfuritalea sp.]
MSDPIDFWFDFSSPYSYLASEVIDDLAAKHGRKVHWRPIMLGAAFKASGLPFLINIPLKGDYSKHDFDRSARFLGVPYKFPPKFPLPTLAAARGYYWLHGQNSGKAREFAHAIFRAYWVEGRDISELSIVLEAVDSLGIDREAFAAAIATQEIKDRVKQETDAAIAKGMFGAPYFMVDGETFWGVDRLPQIDKWLATGGF